MLKAVEPTAEWLPGSGSGPSPAGAAVERFRVVKRLAEGGIGLVSVALGGELNREVALKEIQGPSRGASASSAQNSV